MTRKKKPHEDKTVYVVAAENVVNILDEFLHGDFICTCHECGIRFIGMEDSYFCASCLKEIYADDED
jgi:hypothetical protein